MKKLLLASLCMAACFAAQANAALLITGVVDGPRAGGNPKAIELYATEAIADLSIYNIETPNNGAAATGAEFALSGSAAAGDFIYVASETPNFEEYFGFAPQLVNGVANINGDDNVILYENGVTIDQFGVNGEDGTGTAWEHTDGYAYRINNTGPDAMFNISNWTFSGIDFLDSQGASGVNGSDGKTVPFGTFTLIPEPSTIALMVASVGALMFRRK
jgi:uncharacterized protein